MCTRSRSRSKASAADLLPLDAVAAVICGYEQGLRATKLSRIHIYITS